MANTAGFKGGPHDGRTIPVVAAIAGAAANTVLIRPVGLDLNDAVNVPKYCFIGTASPVPRSYPPHYECYQLSGSDSLWHHQHVDLGAQ